MSNNIQPTYYHYRSGARNSLSTKHFNEKVVDLSDKNTEKMYQSSNIKVPEPLPRQSKSNLLKSTETQTLSSNSFSNKSTSLKRHSSTSSMDQIQYFSNFPQRSRSRSADFEDMKNEMNSKSARENPEIRTFDRIQNYRLEKNFVIYTEQPPNGFNGTYQSDEDLSPKISPNSNTLPRFQSPQMTPTNNGLRRLVQVRNYSCY